MLQKDKGPEKGKSAREEQGRYSPVCRLLGSACPEAIAAGVPTWTMENLGAIPLPDLSTVSASSCGWSAPFAGCTSDCTGELLHQRLPPSSSFLFYTIRHMLQIAVAAIAMQPVLCGHRKAWIFKMTVWYLRNNLISSVRKLWVSKLLLNLEVITVHVYNVWNQSFCVYV